MEQSIKLRNATMQNIVMLNLSNIIIFTLFLDGFGAVPLEFLKSNFNYLY